MRGMVLVFLLNLLLNYMLDCMSKIIAYATRILIFLARENVKKTGSK